MTYKMWAAAAVASFLLIGGSETASAGDTRICASQHMRAGARERAAYARDTRRPSRRHAPAMKQDETLGPRAEEQGDDMRSARARECDLGLPIRCGWGSRGIGQWGTEQAAGTISPRRP